MAAKIVPSSVRNGVVRLQAVAFSTRDQSLGGTTSESARLLQAVTASREV